MTNRTSTQCAKIPVSSLNCAAVPHTNVIGTCEDVDLVLCDSASLDRRTSVLRLWSAYIPCITKVSDDAMDAVLKQKRRSRTSLPYTRRRSTKQSCRSIAACAPSSSVTPKLSELLFPVFPVLTRIKDGVGCELEPTSPIAWLKHSSQAWCPGSVKSPSEPRERFRARQDQTVGTSDLNFHIL